MGFGFVLMERLCCSVVLTLVVSRKCKFIFYHDKKLNLCKLVYVFSLIYSKVSPPCGCDQWNWYLNVISLYVHEKAVTYTIMFWWYIIIGIGRCP